MRGVWLVALALAVMGCGRRNFNVDGGDDTDASGDRANYVFVTSTLYTAGGGTGGGLAGADAICTRHANEAGLSGSYAAYLGTPNVPAGSRLAGSRGWQRVDGRPVIDQPSQLTTIGTWYPIALDENGVDVRLNGDEVWTGTLPNGNPAPDTCEGWTRDDDASPQDGEWGQSSAGAGRSISSGRRNCNETSRFYCFELGGNRPLDPPTPTAGRLAFVSASLWTPQGGVSAADTICGAEATAAGKAGVFRAALPQPSIPTPDRFDLQGPTWVRADGVPIVDAAAMMFTAQFSRAHVHLDAQGQPSPVRYWSGSPNPGAASNANTCNTWTTSGAGNFAELGTGDATIRAERFFISTQDCSVTAALLCLQE